MQQQIIEKAEEYAEYLLQMAKYRPARLLEPGSVITKGKSLTHKLLQVYMDESAKTGEPRRLNRATHLLDKLVRKEKLNTLILNLYPGNDGYSIVLKGKAGQDSETVRLPYEESELLEYVDAEQLPPILVDLMEKAPMNMFYNGCVIVEVRDYRRTSDARPDIRHVLLKPSPQSILCDIKAISSDGHRWTQDDLFTLESQLLLATEEPLCLDPSVAVFIVANKLQYERKKFAPPPLKRSIRKYSQVAINRRRKMDKMPAPEHLQLHDFIKKRKEKPSTQPSPNLRLGKPCVDMWKHRPVTLVTPDTIDVEQYAMSYDKPRYTSDTSPVTIEEYVLEAERDQGKICYTRLTIQQRLSDDSYVGELYVDRDHTEGAFKGSSCRFSLGNKHQVKKYIEQFTEIFTEEGRRAVKITHLVPDQPPKVSFTHGASTSTAAAQMAAQAAAGVSPGGSTIQQQPQQSAAPGGSGQLDIAATASLSNLIAKKPFKFSLSMTSSSSMPAPNMSLMNTLSSPPQLVTPTGSLTAHPLSSLSVHQQLARSRSRPGQTTPISPAVTPSSTPTLVGSSVAPPPQFNQSMLASLGKATPSTPTPPSGSGRTPTPTSRRASMDTQAVGSGFLQGLPPGINLQNLTNLQNMGLMQNLQVSLTGVSVPGGGIAVPLSMIASSQSSLITPNTSLMTTPTGIIINSLPGQATPPSTTSHVGSTNQFAGSTGVNTTSSSSGSKPITTTAIASANPQIQGQTMLSVPIGMTGNLSQIMAGLKNQPGRTGPLSLVQIPGPGGQQQIQLVNQASLSAQSRQSTIQSASNLQRQISATGPQHMGQVSRTSDMTSSPGPTGSIQQVTPVTVLSHLAPSRQGSHPTLAPRPGVATQLAPGRSGVPPPLAPRLPGSPMQGGGSNQQGQTTVPGLTAHQLMQLTPQQHQQLQHQQLLALHKQQQQRALAAKNAKRKKST